MLLLYLWVSGWERCGCPMVLALTNCIPHGERRRAKIAIAAMNVFLIHRHQILIGLSLIRSFV
jgi:hypothetical protein